VSGLTVVMAQVSPRQTVSIYNSSGDVGIVNDRVCFAPV